MAQPSVVHRFEIELSDSDRGVYEALSFRVAKHPSESETLFAARIAAYCLNAQTGLELLPGISEPDEPAMRLVSPEGAIALWVDVGLPDARRLHRASKTGADVRVYLHKDAYQYFKDLEREKIHRRESVAFYSFGNGFLAHLGTRLGRDTRGSFVVTGGTLYVDLGEGPLETVLEERHLPPEH